MLKIQEIKDLIRMIDRSSSIDQLSLKQEGTKLEIHKGRSSVVNEVIEKKEKLNETVMPAVENKEVEAPPTPQAENKTSDSSLHTIVSPMVGTFYSSPGPNEKPFVQAGERITEHTVICIVEAMKLFNEIEAEVSGEVIERLVEDGQLVEYGQPLVKVKIG
jgi:acetyl-CoA carboxylase biotin carboxyl carrier protein